MPEVYDSPEEYIAARLAETDPTYSTQIQGGRVATCLLCQASNYVPLPIDHEESCIWMLAREFYPLP